MSFSSPLYRRLFCHRLLRLVVELARPLEFWTKVSVNSQQWMVFGVSLWRHIGH